METTITPPPGLSTWERGVYEQLAAHVDAEAPLVAAYARLAEESGSDYVRYLVALILDDEARHHRMLQELLRAVSAGSVARDDDGDAAVPMIRRVQHADELLEVTERLLRFEDDDKRSLKQLRRSLKDVRDTSLWDVVVDAMRRDTEKHVAILEFLRARLRAAR
jgi:rubrerythrin